MAKKVKMVIFGKPGEGKSTFASKAPDPLFLCTDGNFEWLGLPDRNHIRLSTWKQAKEVINNIVLAKAEYASFKTIVVDLVEDLYVWLEDEFCKKEGIIHIGDYKSMGAGYSVIRKEFFAQISKLLSIDKNVILISHEADKVGKTKAGADTYTYIPSDKMSLTKQWNDIEGQVRYFLRCFSQDEEVNGRVKKKRYLSLIPGQGEYGICRGADEENWPRECELDWNVFSSIIGLDAEPSAPVQKPVEEAKPAEPAKKPRVKKEEPKQEEKPAEKPAPAVEPEEPKQEPDDGNENEPAPQPIEAKPSEENDDEPVVEREVDQPVDTSSLTPEERRKIVLARLAAMKKK